jgi:hypothetical protein
MFRVQLASRAHPGIGANQQLAMGCQSSWMIRVDHRHPLR